MTTEVEWGRVNVAKSGEEVFARGDIIDPVVLEKNECLSKTYNKGRLTLWFKVRDKGESGAIISFYKAEHTLPRWATLFRSVDRSALDEVIVAPGDNLTEKITHRGETIGFRVKHSVPSK